MSKEKLVYEPSTTTHWRNLFPSKMLLLGSQNLNQDEELIATIEAVTINEIRNQKGDKENVPVLTFTNAPPMVLNITNTRTIASLYGDLYDEWIGRSIQIYATMVRAFGKEGMALRVKETIPTNTADVSAHEKAIEDCKTLDELKKVWMAIPKQLKPLVTDCKNKQKGKIDEGN